MSFSRYDQSEYIWFLQLRNKGLEKRIASFESGSAYVNLRNKYETELRGVEAVVKDLKHQLADSNEQIKKNREHWFEVFDDLMEEHDKRADRLLKEIECLKARILELQRQRDEALDKLKEFREKYYRIGAELEEEKGKNIKLTAQVNKDFENSSVPSSNQGPGRKKVHNSREKSGRKPGGQKGHKGHRLHQMEPTNSVHIPDPEKYVNDPDYYATEEVVKRQKIVLYVDVRVQEYIATVFRNRKTGSRVHAKFPDGYETDISYDSSVKGLAFMLSNFGNMSLGKICDTLREVSHGKVNISRGTVAGLCREFSEKSKPERQKIIRDLMTSSVMNADFTNANVNGKAKQVLILASPENGARMYIARDSKGHMGVLGTPLENYVGTVIHDHDKTFYSYGLRHQECMQHNIRYLIGSEQNEPERKWHCQMHKLVQEMIHYRNSLGDDDFDPNITAGFEKRYDDILAVAKEEYENDPPSDYYREGYNLYIRLKDYKESELLFLHDKRVPANNSLAERLARVFKRKQKQMMVIRSDENHRYLCDDLSVIETFRCQNDGNLYNMVCEVLSREKKRKPHFIPSINCKKADA